MQQLINETRHVNMDVFIHPERYGAPEVLREVRKARHNSTVVLKIANRYTSTNGKAPDENFDYTVQELRSAALSLQSKVPTAILGVLFGNGTRIKLVHEMCDEYERMISNTSQLVYAIAGPNMRRQFETAA